MASHSIQVTIVLLTIALCCSYCYTVLDVTSSVCIKRYAVTNHFYIGYPITPEVFMCRCHCINDTARERFGQAIDHYKEKCIRYINELRGFCVEKIEENMIKTKCPSGGFAYCYIKISVHNTYYFKTFEYQNTVFRLTFDQGETIDVPIENEYVNIGGLKYKVYINGRQCHKTEHFVRSYENIRDDDDNWLESCTASSFGNKFFETNVFNISDDFNYHKKLWPTIQFADDICYGNLSAFSLRKPKKLLGNNCKKLNHDLQFRYEGDSTAFLYQKIDVVLGTSETTSSSSALTTKFTTSSSNLHQLTSTEEAREELKTGDFSKEKTLCECNCEQRIIKFLYIIIILLVLIFIKSVINFLVKFFKN